MIGDDKQLARARSNQDARCSNDYTRAAAQLSVLINGAAATAILAYISNIQITSSPIKHVAPFALAGYALGVIFGALMMFFMTFCAGLWAEHWREVADGKKEDSQEAKRKADQWWCRAYVCFAIAIGLFFGSSGVIAVSLLVNLA